MQTVSATPETYGRDASLARFSVDRYNRMVETGIIDDDDKVELLENYVVLKIARNAPNDGTILRASRWFHRQAFDGWSIREQMAVVLGDSRPEPDVLLARDDADDDTTRHPGATDTGLAVEVADDSLRRDQIDKARIYARALIPTYWIVNIPDHRVEVHTDPDAIEVAHYRDVRHYHPGDDVPVVLDGLEVTRLPVSTILR